MSEAVSYRVSMSRPHSHLFEVEARFPGTQDVVDAVLPVWTPGSYLVREYARHLQDVTASDDRGQALPIPRVDKRTFRVQSGGRPVVYRYRVYANEPPGGQPRLLQRRDAVPLPGGAPQRPAPGHRRRPDGLGRLRRAGARR